MTRISTRLHANDLGEQYWESDRLALRTLTLAQRQAQLRARERLVRHARRVQHLVESGRLPAGDEQQRAVVDGIADLMQILLEHARQEHEPQAAPSVRAARVPIPAPAAIWAPATPPSVPQARADYASHQPSPEARTMCRRCGGALVRNQLAAALDRPMPQGWRHVDGRNIHHPDPVEVSTPHTA